MEHIATLLDTAGVVGVVPYLHAHAARSSGNFLQINLTDHFVQGIYVTFAQLRPTHMCDDQNANDVAEACVGVQVLNSDFMCTTKYKYNVFSSIDSVKPAWRGQTLHIH